MSSRPGAPRWSVTWAALGDSRAQERAAPARWASLLLLGGGIAILAAFAATTNYRQIGDALRGIRGSLLALAGAAVASQILRKAFRWRFMIERLTGTAISWRFGAISVVSGVAAGSITPGRSFELAKAVMLKGSYNVPLGISTSAMIVERMLDIVFLVAAFLGFAALVPTRMVLASRLLALLIAALIATTVLVVLAPAGVQAWIGAGVRRLPVPASVRDRGLRLLETFFSSLLLLRGHTTLWPILGMTLGVTALDVVRVATVFQAMAVPLTLVLVAFAYLGAAMLGMALLVPGGVGVTEVSMAGLIALLAPGAVAPGLARSAVLVDRVLSYYLLVVIGAGLLVAYHRLRHIFE
jgi:glycosyltransferase 2 family protein